MKSPRQLVYGEYEHIGAVQPGALGGLAIGGRETLVGVGLLTLIVGTDHLGINVGGFRLRLELIVGGLLALYFIVRTRGLVLRRLGIIEYALLGWLGANLLSSLFFSPSPGVSLKNSIIIAGVLTIYLLGLMLFRSARAITWAAVAWVAVGAAVSLVGLVSAFLYTFLGWTGGIDLERAYRDGIFVLTPRVQSAMWEPNIFGSYAVTVGILAFALTLSPEFSSPRRQLLLRLAAGCAFCGVMLSMTRAVWLIGPFLLLVLMLLALRWRLANITQLAKRMLLPAMLGIGVGLIVGNFLIPTLRWQRGYPWNLTYEQVEQAVPYLIKGIAPPPEIENPQAALPLATAPTAISQPGVNPTSSVVSETATPTGASVSTGSTLIDKMVEATSPGSAPSVQGRLRIFSEAVEGWLKRPILGWGAGSFPLVYTPDFNGYWVSNLELHLLFDTGVVGLLLFGVAVVVAALRGRRALRAPTLTWNTTHFVLLGLLLGGAGLLLAYQLTEATWLGFTWVFFALLVMSAQVAARTNISPETPDEG